MTTGMTTGMTVLTHVPGMAHVTGMNSIYQPRLVTLMLVVSLASRHVSGITRLVSGITSLTFNASVMIKILNVKQ